MSIFSAISSSINQDKGFIYGLANNAISYAQSKKAQRRAYEYARKLAEQQYDLTQRGYLESSSNIRAGLEKAGFNPMLAIQNGSATGSGSFSSGAVNANPVEGPDLVSNVTDFQRLKNETMTAESQSNLANEQAKTEDSKRKNLSFQNAMLDVEKHLKEKDLSTYDRRFYSEMYEQMQRAENYRAMASVQGYNAESARISANAQKAVADSDVKWAGLRAVSGAVGTAIGAGIGAYGGIKGAKILNAVPKRLPLGKRR